MLSEPVRCSRDMLCRDPQILKQFFDAHRGEDRRQRSETAEMLIEINRGLELLREPGGVAAIRKAVDARGSFGYEQLEPRATWIEPARRVLLRYAIERGDGNLGLALRYDYDADGIRQVLRLVDVRRPHLLVNCVAIGKLERLDGALDRLLAAILEIARRRGDMSFAIFEAERLVPPLSHPLRDETELEYVLQSRSDDRGPQPRIRPGRQADRLEWTMAEVASATGRELVPTYSGGTGGYEMVTAVEALGGAHLLLKPALAGDPKLSGAQLERRARELREIAIAVATREEYAGDRLALDKFNARESPLALEYLCILRGLLGAAGAWKAATAAPAPRR